MQFLLTAINQSNYRYKRNGNALWRLVKYVQVYISVRKRNAVVITFERCNTSVCNCINHCAVFWPLQTLKLMRLLLKQDFLNWIFLNFIATWKPLKCCFCPYFPVTAMHLLFHWYSFLKLKTLTSRVMNIHVLLNLKAKWTELWSSFIEPLDLKQCFRASNVGLLLKKEWKV